MILVRRIFVIVCLLAVGALTWAGIYARKQGFTHTWRELIEEELDRQGHYVDIGKLTLGAFRGLVAEDVRFYRDRERTERFAEVDDIYLDVGLERIFEKKVSIDSLDIHDARLTVPLSTDDPEVTDKLHIHNISGRIALTESRIEIVRVQANLAGVDVFLEGSLLRPPNRASNMKEALDDTIAQFQSLKKLIDTLQTFEFPGGNPQLRITFHSDLRNLKTTSAFATLSAGTFRKKSSSYDILGLDATAEFDGRTGQVKFPRFQLRDRTGLIDGVGALNRKINELDFEVSSSADIAQLAELVFPDRRWGEIVFFQPPAIKAEGMLKLDEILSGPEDATERTVPTGNFWFPGQILGEFQTDRFVTSGIVFNGSRGDFSIKENRFYIRNLRADHKSGLAFLNLKYDPALGRETLQFQTEIKMDPRVFSPFLRDEEARRFLRRWSFSDSSGVYLAAAGQCSNLTFDDLQAKGVIDLRDFRLNQVPFLELETDFEIENSQRWYRNVRLTRDEGQIEAKLAHVDTATRRWEVREVESRVSLGEGFGAFSPKLKEILRPYRFSSPPTIRAEGIIDARPPQDRGSAPSETGLNIEFSSDGTAYYDFLGRTFPLHSPEGLVRLEGDRAHLRSLSAGLLGGTIDLEFDAGNFNDASSPFDASITLDHVAVRSLGKLYGQPNESAGHLDGTMHFSGTTGDISSLNGHGQFSLDDRDLFLVPAIAPLRRLLEKHEPTFSATPSRITQSFAVESGSFSSRDLDLTTHGVPLGGNTTIRFPEKTISVELRSGGGTVYRAGGNLEAPEWEVAEPPPDTTLSVN